MAIIEVGWEMSNNVLPETRSTTPYFRSANNISSEFEEELLSLGPGNIRALFGYGSSFVGRGDGKRKDFLAVVGSTREFHQTNSWGDILHYGTTKNPDFHERLQRFGPNYYHGEIEGQRFKFVVIGLDDFSTFSRSARRDTFPRGRGADYFYLPGRLSKLLTAIYPQDLNDLDPTIKRSINHAKTDCLWLALSQIPPIFTEDEWLTAALDLSYQADFRVELNGKAKKLYEDDAVEYAESYKPHVDSFTARGIVAQLDEGIFRTNVRLRPNLVERRLLAAKLSALRRNYLLTWVTVGLDRGLLYAKDKVVKVVTNAFGLSDSSRIPDPEHQFLWIEEGEESLVFAGVGDGGETVEIA